MTQPTASTQAPTTDDGTRPSPGRRIRIAEWIAFAGLVAALLGALGPAEKLRTTYAWPPPDADTQSGRLYTPLLLASRIPQRIEVDLPCRVAAPAGESSIVIATAVHPQRVGALLVTRKGGALTIQVGETRVARVVDEPNGANCARTLSMEGARWQLSNLSSGQSAEGKLRRMPFVNGLFTDAADRGQDQPSVRITTRTHGVDTTWTQAVAWLLALTCSLASLAMVAAPRRRPWLERVRKIPRRLGRSAHPVDAVVGGLLLVWWLLAPAFYDDGWTIARQSAFVTTGNFSNYYESFGVSLPLGYWLEWLQHWITRSTDALVLMRLSTLVCLAGVWLLCRWILVQIHGAFRTWSSPPLWALAAAYAAMVMAWGMSLRQEPTVAVLAVGVMACCIRFVQTRSTAAIALAALLIPLALTAHPAGIVAIAPLAAIAHECVRWARAHLPVAVTVLTASGALALTLAFVGSDVHQRALDAQTLGTFSTTIADWRAELTRYSVLTTGAADYVGYAAPLRRAAVALMLLACLAYLLRHSRERRMLLDLPSRTLILALVFFIATPSKWPWHFGALIGLVALAVAAETIRWRELRPLKVGLTRSIAGLVVLSLAVLWSWSPRGSWNAADLRTLDWTPQFERLVPLGTAAALLPLMLIGGVILFGGRRRNSIGDVTTRVVSSAALILTVPLAIFTVAVLAIDTARTSDWTTARSNIAALGRSAGCGFADDLRVPRLDSIRPLQTVAATERSTPPAWLPDAPAAGVRRFALGPVVGSTAVTPWFALGSSRDIGWFVLGRQAATDRLELQWAMRRGNTEELLRRDVFAARPTATEETSMPWRLVIEPEVRPTPRRATMVRLALENDAPPAGALAVTSPFYVSYEPLARQLTGGTRTLVLPHVATFFPCADLPHLNHGVVEAPSVVLTTRQADPLLLDPGTSPFNGMVNLFRLQRLPVLNSRGRITDVTAYRIDPRIPGWHRVDPART